MITIKKEHNLDLSNDQVFIDLINKFNNVIRFSYNRRIKDNINKPSELEQITKSSMKNIDCLDASWIKCGVKKSFELQKDNKLYFGGKSSFFKKKFKKTNNLDKNFPLEMRGSSSDSNGNRKGQLNGNIFVFKPYKGIKYEVKLNLSKNEQRMFDILTEECKLNKNYFNFKIDLKYVYISFNEPVLYKHKFIKDRYMGIDLNPNYIGFSIMDKGVKEVHKGIFDLKKLNKSKNSNKVKYEIVQINKNIIEICKSFNVEYVCLEDLNIKSSNKGLGKNFNRLVNNKWLRNFQVNNLVKQMNINSIKYLIVNPFYTSFIGQIKNVEDYDSVAASKEVAYRGYIKVKEIKEQEYVNIFLSGLVTTRWKEMLPNINTFKDLYIHFKSQKKSKNSYRFLFNDVEKLKWSSLRLKSNKSFVDLIKF